MKGFQQTEIGLFPDNWKLSTIGDCFEIRQGKQVSARNRAGNNVKQFLRTANVFWGKLDLSKLDAMNFSEDEIRDLTLKANDLLVCEGGDIGRTALWRDEISDCYYQNHLHRLRARGTSIYPEFYLYWMMYGFPIGKVYFGIGNNTTIPNLSQSRLKSLLIPQPSVSEQKKIADLLFKIQCIIEAQEKIIQTTTELKKAVIQGLFTEGLREEPRKETEVGKVPQSWELLEINSLGEIVTGTTPPTRNKKYYESGGFPFISPGDLGKTKYVYNTKKEISDEGLKVSRVLPKDAVMVVCIGSTIGKVGLTFSEKNATNQQINTIICNNNFNPHYVYYLLNYKKRYIKSLSTPSPVPILSKGKFQKGIVPISKNISEQNEIATILSSIDCKLEKAKELKNIYQCFFKAMLHNLMTGRICVKDLKL